MSTLAHVSCCNGNVEIVPLDPTAPRATTTTIRNRREQLIEGTVPPDFSPLVFFFKQLLLALVDKPSNDFDFIRIFAKIFDFSGAWPVSLTPAKQTILF
jgi:hypothetical protein